MSMVFTSPLHTSCQGHYKAPLMHFCPNQLDSSWFWFKEIPKIEKKTLLFVHIALSTKETWENSASNEVNSVNGCIFNPSLQVLLNVFALGPRDVFVRPEPEVGSFKKSCFFVSTWQNPLGMYSLHRNETFLSGELSFFLSESCPETLSSPGKCSWIHFSWPDLC